MWSFIKKDLLLFWRDRKELVTILTLPIVLVLVMNFAFSGMFGSDDEEQLDLQLAIVNEDDEREGLDILEGKLMAVSSSEDDVMQFVEYASHLRPASLLFDYFNSDELSEWLTVHELQESEAVAKVEEGDLDGILVIPDGFTVDSLYAVFVGEPSTTSLIYKMERETINSSTIYQIVQGFIEHMNNEFALQEIGGAAEAEILLPEGGFEAVGAGERFTVSQYFTIAMGILFSLFVAVTVATKTGEELRQQVINRILLTNSHPLQFLLGKIASTFCLVWLQIMFVFVLSHFILDVFPDRTIAFWFGVVGIVMVLSLAIAGLAAMFTSISLRVKDLNAASGIFMIVLLLFGMSGGNFVPVFILPNWLQELGEWTPNGQSLVILTEWVQFEQFSTILTPSLLLIGHFLLFTTIALALYPKRGKTN
ncbi:ABC transporter permease [Halalkalibacter sp. APA_J-10(15)]|uniref:ABC transporter permease n=1 Tax=Halalkalibacter sp. APA_J-10(15) TaxID=2933805 RepID=UPI001FF172D5|nr:ABC transporter permease [Halalkalibacter sp. APA_J-10(15)]MCK0471674.1 ABC transporter permease [Halalkalibacter sp. APA_J-10(15)]